MATMDQVEKLREKANITYNEAKVALEACGDDLLDAVIYLERQGKVKPPNSGGYYSSKSQAEAEKESVDSPAETKKQNGESFSRSIGRIYSWCCRVIAKGNQNGFEVRKRDRLVITIPVTILVLLLLFAFWVVVPLLIIGLFFNFHYVFKGSDLEKTRINHVLGSAANAAENFKNDVARDRTK